MLLVLWFGTSTMVLVYYGSIWHLFPVQLKISLIVEDSLLCLFDQAALFAQEQGY